MEYKQIPGMVYSISDSGVLINSAGRELRGYVASGYHCHKLLEGLPSRKTFLTHRLVWQAWVGPIPKGYWINHKDGNKLNNNLSNLECDTPKHNHIHARDVLRRRYVSGFDHGSAVLSDLDIEAAVALSSLGWSHAKIAEVLLVSAACISIRLSKINTYPVKN